MKITGTILMIVLSPPSSFAVDVVKRQQFGDIVVYGIIEDDEFIGCVAAKNGNVVSLKNFPKSIPLIDEIYRYIYVSSGGGIMTREESARFLDELVSIVSPGSHSELSLGNVNFSGTIEGDNPFVKDQGDGTFKIDLDELKKIMLLIDEANPLARKASFRYAVFNGRVSKMEIWEFELSKDFKEIITVKVFDFRDYLNKLEMPKE